MGLIKAAMTAAKSTLGDAWKEFFYCDALPGDILMAKGHKRTGAGSSNHGDDNIITQGSVIAVADGQCMIIVDQGRVVEICAEPGEYTYDMSAEGSVFSGKLGEGLKSTFSTIGRRMSFGGDTARVQRVYYFNLREMMDNKFGTPQPIPFRVSYPELGRSFTASLRCNGSYSYRIVDPLLFYTSVCGNVTERFTRADIETQLKAEFIDALLPAFGMLSDQGIRYDQLTGSTAVLKDAMNSTLKNSWRESRGIMIERIMLNPITMSKEDEDRLKKFEDLAWNRDPLNAAAVKVDAEAQALRTAAGNTAGTMTGFMGMGMAQMNSGMSSRDLFATAQQMQAQQAARQPSPALSPAPAGSWKCACGTENTGKFCLECGQPKPAAGWTCACGAVSTGKFCPECGKPRAVAYKCSKCGWVPEDPRNPPKFCPECGDPFDQSDVQ